MFDPSFKFSLNSILFKSIKLDWATRKSFINPLHKISILSYVQTKQNPHRHMGIIELLFSKIPHS